MANKAISELPQAQNVNNQDLFVLEQSGIAKKLTAETFITEQGIIDALAEALDGHGGIQSVTLSSVSGRIRTYLITFSDGSATTFQVLDGTSIDRITKTSTAGLVDTYTIFMSDGTTSFFQVTNGGYGLDRTLTMSNAAAPADLVGDLKSALTSNSSVIDGIGGISESQFTPLWEQGTITSGANANSTTRIRTGYINFSKDSKITINVSSGYKASITFYDSSKTYKREQYWITSETTIESFADGYVRFVLGKSSDASISLSDSSNLQASIEQTIVNRLNAFVSGGYIDIPFDYLTNGYIHNTNGTVVSYNGWKYTDYIPVDKSSNGKILIKLLTSNGNQTTTSANFNGWYDARKQYIKNLTITNQEIEIPGGVAYVRLSCNNANSIILKQYVDGQYEELINDATTWKQHEDEKAIAKYIPYSVGNSSSSSFTGDQYKRTNLLFFTDNHIDYFNPSKDVQNVKDTVAFANNFPIKFDAVINGGDAITPFGVQTKASSKEKIAVFFDEAKKSVSPFIFAKGNHDLNDWNNTPANTFTDADWSEIWYDYAETKYGIVRQTKSSGDKSTWHYYDLADKQIRIIAVDVQDTDKSVTDGSGNVFYYGGKAWYISNEQMNWIVDTALNFDNKDDKNWGVVIVSHQYHYSDNTGETPYFQDATIELGKILKAFNTQTTYSISYTFATDSFYNMSVNADFTRYALEDNPPHVICWLLGHEHLDKTETLDGGINQIWTTCGAVDTSGDSRLARVADTVTQNAFDLISIDTAQRKIRYIRYGAGENCYGVGGDRFLPDGLSY